nr:SERTA domain-containing protein 3 isoform X3 [Microcebus murinus]
MVGGLKRKHSDVEGEEADEKWDWSPAGLQSYQQALLRISLDKVQRSLGPRAPSLRRELETSMDETEPPHNPVASPSLQNELPPQPDPVFLEALSSRYLGDSGLDDFFLDIDTSAVEKEPALAPPEPPHNLFCAPGFHKLSCMCVRLVTPAFCEVPTPLVTTGGSGKIKKARPVKG